MKRPAINPVHPESRRRSHRGPTPGRQTASQKRHLRAQEKPAFSSAGAAGLENTTLEENVLDTKSPESKSLKAKRNPKTRSPDPNRAQSIEALSKTKDDLGQLNLGQLNLGQLNLGQLNLGQINLGKQSESPPSPLPESDNFLVRQTRQSSAWTLLLVESDSAPSGQVLNKVEAETLSSPIPASGSIHEQLLNSLDAGDSQIIAASHVLNGPVLRDSRKPRAEEWSTLLSTLSSELTKRFLSLCGSDIQGQSPFPNTDSATQPALDREFEAVQTRSQQAAHLIQQLQELMNQSGPECLKPKQSDERDRKTGELWMDLFTLIFQSLDLLASSQKKIHDFGVESSKILLQIDNLRATSQALQKLAFRQPFARILAESSAENRQRAAWFAGYLGPKAQSLVPDLIDRLRDSERAVRHAAAWALEQIATGRSEAIPAALPTLRQRQPE